MGLVVGSVGVYFVRPATIGVRSTRIQRLVARHVAAHRDRPRSSINSFCR